MQATTPTERYLCIVMHDVSPATWPACVKLLSALDEVVALPHTLLVVPNYHRGTAAQRDPNFCALMSERLGQGHELALHGYSHLDDQPLANSNAVDSLRRRIYTAGEGEFSSLSEQEASARLAIGAAWFAENGWPLHGFVAPAWLMSAGTWQALKQMPLSYTSTLRRFYTLPDAEAMFAPSLVYSARSAWRRAVSKHWVAALAATQRNRPLLRLGLHPIDAEYPAIVRHWQALLEEHIADRRGVTKAEFAKVMRGAQSPTSAENLYAPR